MLLIVSIAFLFSCYLQLTIALSKESEDPEKNKYNEYYYAGGLVEYVKWLNTDKVRFLVYTVKSSSGFALNLLANTELFFQRPIHDVVGFHKAANGVTIDAALQW